MSGLHYFKIFNGLLEPKHVESMGEAVWLYMWLQEKCTSVNENGEGKVLGNKPIVFEDDIVPDLGISRPTYARWVNKLRKADYIKTLRTPRGLVIVITKAKKFANSDVSRTNITTKKAKSDVSHVSSDVSKSTLDVSKSNMQYKIKQLNNKDIITTTNVVGPDKPTHYGKPEINEAFAYWQETVGYAISSKVRMNRNAANNLIKKHKLDGVKQLIRGVALAHEDKYAPGIADFIQLQSKLNDLLKWGKKRGNSNAIAQF